MAIQNARSNNTGAAPSALVDGQVAIGQADGILFTRTSAGAVRRFLLPKRAGVADAAYPCTAFDTYVGIASLTASRAITLPAASAYPTGHPLVVVDESGACSSTVALTLTAAGSDKINGNATLAMNTAYLGLFLFCDGTSKWTAIAIPGAGGSAANAVLYVAQTLAASAQRQALANLGHAGPIVRQAAIAGPASSGAPSFLTTSSTLTLAFQNISAASPLVLACAKGAPDGAGASDAVAVFTANPSVTLPPSQAYVAPYWDFDAAAWGSSTLAPIFQFGGTISTVAGQYTFDFQAMVGWVGNAGGTAAVRANRVYVGEGATSATAVTAMVAYPYNGLAVSPWVTGLPATSSLTTWAHNLGVQPSRVVVELECVTADGGFSVGDRLATDRGVVGDNGSSFVGPTLTARRLAVVMSTASYASFRALSPSSGGTLQTLTAGSWKFRLWAMWRP